MVERLTRFVLTVKVAEVAPSGTVTLAGTVATLVLLLARLTTAPPAGAGMLSVTVPIELEPPFTVVGFNVTDLSTGHPLLPTFNRALTLEPLYVPAIVTLIADGTGLVLIVKFADMAPAA